MVLKRKQRELGGKGGIDFSGASIFRGVINELCIICGWGSLTFLKCVEKKDTLRKREGGGLL